MSTVYTRGEVPLEDSSMEMLEEKTRGLRIGEQPPVPPSLVVRSVGVSSFIFLVALAVRSYKISRAAFVVWDEAHFGKFGAYYIRHRFYHDVHPPLGKMLVALSGWLVGFNGEFEFASGDLFPAELDYQGMRLFQAAVGLVVPVCAYWLVQNMELGLGSGGAWLAALAATLELTHVLLLRFILLDALLLAFTATTFWALTLVHWHRVHGREFSAAWWLRMALLGLLIGCVCSVKWVGLFVTLLAGAYTVYDLLFVKVLVRTMLRRRYYLHWLARVVMLVLVPFAVYVLLFKVHFALLTRSGSGDGSMLLLFQANLEDTDIDFAAPRSVAWGSTITLRSHGLLPNLLHSHHQTYPVGLGQRQITTYGYKDDNNEWVVYPAHNVTSTGEPSTHVVQSGDTIRLVHSLTRGNLHLHSIAAPVTRGMFEVSGYGNDNEVADQRDDWVVEVVEQLTSVWDDGVRVEEAATEIHPLSSAIRLRHKELGCYLATTGYALPAWGFEQGEVVCKQPWLVRDKSTWWNVEMHTNAAMPAAPRYRPPRSPFWRDFLLLNVAMMNSNNALVPDPNKEDGLASSWWEWPTLHRGLRMNGWGPQTTRYYLLGHPLLTAMTSLLLVAVVVVAAHHVFRYRRQQWRAVSPLTADPEMDRLVVAGVLPVVGWVLQFVPFVAMARVTYVHHYVPAAYFAIFVWVFVVDAVVGHSRAAVRGGVLLLLAVAVVWGFVHFRGLVYGMEGPLSDWDYLVWRKLWHLT